MGCGYCEFYASIVALQPLLESSNVLLHRMFYRVLGKEVDDYRAFFSHTQETKDLIRKHFGLHNNFFSERANNKTCTYRYAKYVGPNTILRGTIRRLVLVNDRS